MDNSTGINLIPLLELLMILFVFGMGISAALYVLPIPRPVRRLVSYVVFPPFILLALYRMMNKQAAAKEKNIDRGEAIPHYNKRWLPKFLQSPFFPFRFNLLVPYSARLKHTYILGASGSGKSELLKLFIYNDIQKAAGVLVIDPHGDFISQCARMRLFSEQYRDKLVYISPEYMYQGLFPRFNPMEHDYHRLPDIERQNLISVRADELVGAFQVICESDFTHNMELLLRNCLRLLMEYQGTTLFDLLNLINPAVREPFQERARTHWDDRLQQYFATLFVDPRLNSTKAAVQTRLENVFSNQSMKMMLGAGRSTFDITELLSAGKVVLVNASQGYLGEHGTRTLGAFLLAELTSFALGRAKVSIHQRKPIFVYVDECQNFLNPKVDKILTEARKYGIHMTLANQFMGQFHGEGLTRVKKSVLANTQVKFCGDASMEDKRAMGREMNMSVEAIPHLYEGKFAMKRGSRYEGVAVSMYDFLLQGKNGVSEYYMSQAEWKAIEKRQLDQFYTSQHQTKRKPFKETQKPTSSDRKKPYQPPKPKKLL